MPRNGELSTLVAARRKHLAFVNGDAGEGAQSEPGGSSFYAMFHEIFLASVFRIRGASKHSEARAQDLDEPGGRSDDKVVVAVLAVRAALVALGVAVWPVLAAASYRHADNALTFSGGTSGVSSTNKRILANQHDPRRAAC